MEQGSKRHNFVQRHSGFTLIELMIVVAVIAVLAAIAIPQYSKFTAKSRRAEAYVILKGIHRAEVAYFATYDTYVVGTVQPVKNNTDALALLGMDDIRTPRFYKTLTEIGGAKNAATAFCCPNPNAFTVYLYGDIDGDVTEDLVNLQSGCPTIPMLCGEDGQASILIDDLFL